MPDNWSFVIAAYGLTAIVLGVYWRRLVRKEKELHRAADRAIAERSRDASRPRQSRPDPAARQPLP